MVLIMSLGLKACYGILAPRRGLLFPVGMTPAAATGYKKEEGRGKGMGVKDERTPRLSNTRV
jgi:hypothetical protein